MDIVSFDRADSALIEQAATLLVEGFTMHAPKAWSDLASGLEEVRKALAPDNIALVAVDESGRLLGWIGGMAHYDGHVWELHPLVVHPQHQRQGIGRALVEAFEDRVRRRGGLTIQLGSDDLDDQTTLSGVDLYDNLWDRIANIRNLRGHPYEFYEKLGYVITGVVPDANGLGKPDILLSKRMGK